MSMRRIAAPNAPRQAFGRLLQQSARCGAPQSDIEIREAAETAQEHGYLPLLSFRQDQDMIQPVQQPVAIEEAGNLVGIRKMRDLGDLFLAHCGDRTERRVDSIEVGEMPPRGGRRLLTRRECMREGFRVRYSSAHPPGYASDLDICRGGAQI